MTAAAAFAAAAARPVVVCDVDGVLAFTAEAIACALNARFGIGITAHTMSTYRVADTLPKDRAQWLYTLLESPSFFANVAPDWRAVDALTVLLGAGLRVVVSSDRPTGVAAGTSQWLDRWQVPRDDTVLIGRGGKETVLASHGPGNPAVLIDDDPAKWLTVARPGVQVWCPARPYTPAAWRRYPHVWVFDDWSDVLDRLGAAAAV